MGQAFEWILVALAYMAALVLASLGVRCLHKRNPGRCGIFIAALSFFLMGDAAFTQEPTAQQPAQAIPPKEKSLITTKESTKLPIPPELSAPGRWQAFKTFWQKLDAIDTQAPIKMVPAENTEKSVSGQRGFYLQGALTEDELRVNQKELNVLFGMNFDHRIPLYGNSPVLSSLILADETSQELMPSMLARVLYFLAASRLQSMADTGAFVAIHAAPPLRQSHPDAVIRRLEVRIDLLMKKQAEGTLSAKEYTAILASIEKDLHLLAVLSTLSSVRGLGREWGPVDRTAVRPMARMESMSPLTLVDDPAAWQRGMEQAYQSEIESLDAALASQKDKAKKEEVRKTIADLEAGMTRTRARIAELDKLRAPLRLLLEDLEHRPAAK